MSTNNPVSQRQTSIFKIPFIFHSPRSLPSLLEHLFTSDIWDRNRVCLAHGGSRTQLGDSLVRRVIWC